MNTVALRLLNQQLISPQFTSVEEVADYMCAMQAQDYRMMRWAMAMRTKNPSAKTFKKAFDDGRIVRLHLMRGTWQIVSAANYWWLLELCAPRAISLIKGFISSNKITISDEELLRVREIIAQTAADKGSATKEDFVQALVERGIVMDAHRLNYHIRMAEMEGVICSGALLPTKTTYALAANRITPATPIDRDEALMRMARLYFNSRQPATLDDFVWWSGLTLRDCRKGIALLGDGIHKENYFGREFYLTDDCRSRGFRKGKYLLVPPYDEYLISYKSRDIVLPPEYKHKAHNNNGIFQPIIVRDGIVCGNWTPYKENPQPSFFLGDHDTDLQAEWDAYKKFL
ncbi:winged helix DNA-binding domain-containing protein [Prevotella falsenii]|uniref:winged helix DNA-binding domain-containing protein n=1 Tax=Prevotella falsenii TaxID=515414 RepID=UPI000469A61A|nr:winged helix DNA-binding domain-containing protein [Prevotella falsenii]